MLSSNIIKNESESYYVEMASNHATIDGWRKYIGIGIV